MSGLKSYLLNQTTDVLTAALKANTSPESNLLLESILFQRKSLLNKYSHKKLLDMTPAQLIELLNSSQIRSEDPVASKTIMLDIFNILDEKAPDTDISFCKDLITYLKDHA